MESSKDRTLPYLGAVVYYFALYYLFYDFDIPSIFKILILGAAISLLVLCIINLKWKISAHTIGVGGLVGAMIGIELYYLLILVVIVSGFVGFARLNLKAHSPNQVYAGFLLGLTIELLLVVFN
jgi:membrane-associated phospholipid phosphatase